MRIGLVACSATKAPEARPASQLYRGQLHRLALDYARFTCDEVFILSARHGLVHLDDVLEPYDSHLLQLSRGGREAWGERVVDQLAHWHPTVDDLHLVLLAGAPYVNALPRTFLEWTSHETPLAHRGIGHQKQWLAHELAILRRQVLDSLGVSL